MTHSDLDTLFEAIDHTWPAAKITRDGVCTIRSGLGGGSRVSAATAEGVLTEDALRQAEHAMKQLGQSRLFMVRDGETELDQMLAKNGYVIKDPVHVYSAPVAQFEGDPPFLTAFTVWPPLAAQRDVWAQGGIGPERLAIMQRAKTPKISFLGRAKDRPSGTVYVAAHGPVAMLHALEVLPAARRQSLGRNLTLASARWAERHGCTHLTLLATKANAAANALYSSLGMTVVGQYHYRIKPD